jgi:Schlafen, AlbA_2
MLTESRPLEALLVRLRAEPRVWVRLAVNRPIDDWQLSLLEVTLVEPPPGWTRQSWLYERAYFVAAAPAGATVARWIERGRIRQKPVSLAIAVPNSRVQVERRESRFIGIFQPLPWPSVEWRVHLEESPNRQMLHGELVARDAPVFLSHDLAGRAFFGVAQIPGDRGFSGCEFVIRDQDRRARIDAVRVRSTEVIVNVRGDQLAEAMLTLGGLDGPTKRLRRDTTEVHLPLPGGIPSGSWLALHRGHELLDRRGLDPALGDAADVELEVDPVTEVEVLISGGEDVSTEFKRQLPSTDREAIVTVMKTVAAFANGAGGTLLFGVENDGRICGFSVDDMGGAVDRMTSLIRDWVRPLVDFEPKVAEVDRKKVLLVRVKPGVETPYGVSTTDRRIDYYVRRGGTTFPATPADVRAIVHLRIPIADQATYLGWR